MKKLTLIIGLGLVGAAIQATPADDFMQFKNMELQHKNDWFDHMKRLHDTKFDLMKKNFKEWVAYSNQNSRDWQNSTDCSPYNKDVIFTDHLNRAITLHKKQNAQWKNLCEKLHREALNIQRKHEKELSGAIAKFNKAR